MPKLRIKQGDDFQEVMIGETTFRIGRAAGSDYVINSGFISRNHCEIIPENGEWVLVDLGSALGTQLNGYTITRAKLNPGDRICLSDKFEAFFSPDEIHVDNTATLRIQTGPPTPPKAKPKTNRLVALDGPLAHKVFELQPGINRLGRAEDNHIAIPVDTISKYHAEISVDEHGVFLSDQGSGNGTFVGNTRIRRHQLQPGDLMRFDWVTFRFEDPEYRQDTTGTRIRRPKESADHDKPTNPGDNHVGDVNLVRASMIANMSMRIKRARTGEEPSKGVLALLVLFVLGFVGLLFAAGYFLFTFMTQPDTTQAPERPAVVKTTEGQDEPQSNPSAPPAENKPNTPRAHTPTASDTGDKAAAKPLPQPAPPPFEGPDFSVLEVAHRPESIRGGQEVWVRLEFKVNRPSILLTESVRLYRGSKMIAKPVETTGEWAKNLQENTHRFLMPKRLRPGPVQVKITLSSANTVIERSLDIQVE